MKTLFIVTAALEAGVGVALVCCPSETVSMLLGYKVESDKIRCAGAMKKALSD